MDRRTDEELSAYKHYLITFAEIRSGTTILIKDEPGTTLSNAAALAMAAEDARPIGADGVTSKTLPDFLHDIRAMLNVCGCGEEDCSGPGNDNHDCGGADEACRMEGCEECDDEEDPEG
jgi:hypothetical protein